MTTPTTDSAPTPPAAPTTVNVLAVRRGVLVAVSIIGVILGLIGLFFPSKLLVFVAIVFGIYLVMSGIFRIISALLTHNLRVGYRWISGLLGILIVAAGIICLGNPVGTLIVIAYVIGIGWIAAGITDVMAAIQGVLRRRWLALIAGILAILAGIVIFILPALSIITFEFYASILLLVVSIATLLTMPGKIKLPVV